MLGRAPLLTRALATPLKAGLVLRGVITLVAWLCYYSAARYLPLAQLFSLYFSCPLIVTLLAVPLLGERVTRARWAAVLVGFVQVFGTYYFPDFALALMYLLMLLVLVVRPGGLLGKEA